MQTAPSPMNEQMLQDMNLFDLVAQYQQLEAQKMEKVPAQSSPKKEEIIRIKTSSIYLISKGLAMTSNYSKARVQKFDERIALLENEIRTERETDETTRLAEISAKMQEVHTRIEGIVMNENNLEHDDGNLPRFEPMYARTRHVIRQKANKAKTKP